MDEVLYTDDTKLKDLTVGQLKDIIIETLSQGSLMSINTNRRQYTYSYGYSKHQPSIKVNDPYCGLATNEEA